MPLEGLDEEGLPRNPNLQLAQWRFVLTLDDGLVDKQTFWDQLLEVIKEKGRISLFYYIHIFSCARHGAILYLYLSRSSIHVG